MARGVKRFTDLRAWRHVTCSRKRFTDYARTNRLQMMSDGGNRSKSRHRARLRASPRDSAGSKTDFARFCVIARSSLMESQGHLCDFVDKRYITEDTRFELNQLCAMRVGLENVGSSRVRNARSENRERRPRKRPEEPRTANAEPNL